MNKKSTQENPDFSNKWYYLFSCSAIVFNGNARFFHILISIGLSAWVFFVKVFTDHATPGWASSVLPMYLLGGIQLLSIGVLGEYVAKMYMETKKRPRYILEKNIPSYKLN